MQPFYGKSKQEQKASKRTHCTLAGVSVPAGGLKTAALRGATQHQAPGIRAGSLGIHLDFRPCRPKLPSSPLMFVVSLDALSESHYSEISSDIAQTHNPISAAALGSFERLSFF